MAMDKTNEMVKVTDNRLSARAKEVVVDTKVPVLQRAAILRQKAAVIAEELRAMDGSPIGDKVVVLQLPKGEKFGSIFIPDDAQSEEICGIVVAVGSGYLENGQRIPLEVSPGNYVIYAKYSNSKIQIVDGEELMMIREEDIRFKLGKNEANKS